MSSARKANRARTHGPISGPEEAVFRHLQQKWEAELSGRRIPAAMRRKMRNDASFRRLVETYKEHGCIIDEDTVLVPRETATHDGTGRDRLIEDLGEDPAPHFCPGCGEEKHPADEFCEGCQEAEKRFTR